MGDLQSSTQDLNKIKVELILDSLINNIRVSTLSLWFPRIYLPQFNTHRDFSRNASSMRAVPTERVINQFAVYTPENFKYNKKGMQPGDNLSEIDESSAQMYHRRYDKFSKAISRRLVGLNVAKEQANRYIESISYVKVLFTTTRTENFFNLRIHGDAQDGIRILASKIKESLENSIPIHRDTHFPYITGHEYQSRYSFNDLLKTSVARSARVSYFNFEKEDILSNLVGDRELYNKLVVSQPQHMSPSEHQVFSPDMADVIFNIPWVHRESGERFVCGNFDQGVVQFRKLLECGIQI